MFNRRTTFLTALLETALALVSSLGALLLPLTLLWMLENTSNLDWSVTLRTAADIWLLGHGVPVVISAATISGVKFASFAITILPTGLTALILFSAYRLGRKLAATSSLWPGWAASAAVYFPMSFLVVSLAHNKSAYPVEWLGTFLPSIVFVGVVVLTSLFAKPAALVLSHQFVEANERVIVRERLNRLFDSLGWVVRVVAVPALRAGTGVVASLIGVSALSISLLLAFNWISAIRLYEGMQLSVFGVILVTLAQLALLPNFVVMGAAWFTGAGFSIGAGSLVSPFGTQLGPIPSVPLFAALPVGQSPLALAAIAVPLVAAFAATVAIKKYADELRFEFATAFNAALTLGISIAVVAAIEMAMLTWMTAGAVGPGRLQTFGANPLITAGAVFIETAIAATAGAFLSARPEQPDAELWLRQTR